MINKVIKRIIMAAIESFPINEMKKTELLRSIMDKKVIEEVESDVL